jgi:hypothetical protein
MYPFVAKACKLGSTAMPPAGETVLLTGAGTGHVSTVAYIPG